jgi:hypothetical protein
MPVSAPIHRPRAGISAQIVPREQSLNDQDAYANLDSQRMIPKKLVPDLIRDGHRFSDKIMRQGQ